MTTGKQAVSVQQEGQDTSESNTLQRQLVVVAQDPKYFQFSRSLTLPGESTDGLAALRQSLADDLKSRGTLENECVDEISTCLWRLRRLRVTEAGNYSEAISLGPRYVVDPLLRVQFRKELDRLKYCKPTPGEEDCTLGWAFDRLKETFGNLMSYETSVERSLYRALRTIERLQAMQFGRPCPRITEANS